MDCCKCKFQSTVITEHPGHDQAAEESGPVPYIERWLRENKCNREDGRDCPYNEQEA